MDYEKMPTFVNHKGYTALQAYKSVGKGWRILVRVALIYKPKDVLIVQVKEKYAGLRIYHEPYNERYQEVINVLETVSFHTCEWCGKPGRVDKSYYWVITLCAECREKRKIAKNNE